MSNISEQHGVEMPMYNWLADLGWMPQSDVDLQQYRRPISNPVIEDVLSENIQRINGISAADAAKVIESVYAVINRPDTLKANEHLLEMLTQGITINIAQEDRTIQLVDYIDPWRNSLIVTRQYYVQGSDLVKPDIVLLINGIPVVCIEAKQRAKQSSNYFEGIKQMGLYEMKAPKLYVCSLFGMAANGKYAKYGALGASSSYYFEWKDYSVHEPETNPALTNGKLTTIENAKTGLPDFDIPEYEQMRRAICAMLQPMRVLDLLRHFVVFETSQESGTIKKIARYQQFRAANKIMARVLGKEVKHGVIWHTQGSGKSLTILFTAYKLRHESALADPTVYIVVDRKDLRDQIGDTFEDCDFPNTFKPTNIGQLKQKIADRGGEVIITTIQKFRELGGLSDNRENVYVLIDEAHRTQYGDYHSELKAALPNASRFAFTGTPIPKTISEFGMISSNQFEKYLDRYSIQDAIDDKATKEIRYTFGPSDLQLKKEDLQKGWAEITEDLDEEQKASVIKKVRPWKTIIKKPERIAAIAADIAQDFRTKVEPDGFKAQVVAVDKEACVLYFNELLKWGFDSSEIQIVFSKPSGNETPERYALFKDHYLQEGELKKVITKFRKRITEDEMRRGNNLKILIVCNMLLTGFDAPIEQTMYLDSPFRDHTLLQAIARTNRPYDDKITKVSKEYGRIVDYLGIFKDLNAALNYDPADIGTFRDEEGLFQKFPETIDAAMSPFADIHLEDSYACTIALVRRLADIDQTEFETGYRQTVQLYEAISPSALLVPYIERYHWLLTIYRIYLSEYKRLDFDAELYAAKTRELLLNSVEVLDFRGHLPEVTIDSSYLTTLSNTKLSPDDKAEKIIRDIETVIRRSELQNPLHIDFLQRLDEIMRRRKEHAEDIEATLRSLEELFTEVEESDSLPQRLGFSDLGEFTIYHEVKAAIGETIHEDDIKAFAFIIAKGVKERRYKGWQDSDEEKRKLEMDISIQLCSDRFTALGLGENEEVADKLFTHMLKHYAIV